MTAPRCATRRCAERAARRGAGVAALSAAAAALFALLAAGCGTPAPKPNAAQQAYAASSQSAARQLARGDLAQARALYERALAQAEAVEDFSLAGAALLNLALVHQRSSELAAGHARVERIVAAPQRYGAALHAAALLRSGLLHADARDLDAALQAAGRAEAACPPPCASAAAIADLRAHVALERGDAAGAIAQAERAVALAAQAQHDAEQANALRLLGRARSRNGQHAEAAAVLAQALDIDRRLGLPERIALDLVYAGDNERARAQPAAAREFYERALQVYLAAGQGQGAETARARLSAVSATR
jgi:tetratricopeptide (TPR) repeat protein